MEHTTTTPLGSITWILGMSCLWISKVDPSDMRAWVAFGLGAIASIISIAINWKKFINLFKRKR